MSKRVCLVAFALIVACAAPRRQSFRFDFPERHAQLPNGLRVILLPDPSASLVEVDVRYEVGAAEDPVGKSGLAHVVEHMLFQQRPAGEDKPSSYAALAQIAVYFNAVTTWDSTHFVSAARHEELGSLLAIEGARLSLGCQTISKAAFARELEVVRNEIRERFGDPDQVAEAEVLAAAYPEGHAYHRSVGGDDDELVKLQLDDVCKFVSDYYVPARATLVVSGNVSEAELAPLLTRYFATEPARTPRPRTQVAPLAPARREVKLALDIDEPRVSVVFALPPTYAPLGVMGEEAAARMQGLLAREAFQFDLANNVDVSVRGGALAPVLVATVRLRQPSQADEALDAIYDAAERTYLRRFIETPEDEEGQDLVAYRRAELLMGLESLGRRAWQFAEWAQFDPEGGYLGGALDRLAHLDEPELRSLGRDSLDIERGLVVRVTPTSSSGGLARHAGASARGGLFAGETREIIVDAAEAARPLAVPADVIPAATELTLDNGLHVVLAPTHGPLPIMSAKLVFRVGWANEPRDRAGLASIAAHYLGGPFKQVRNGVYLVFGFVGAEQSVDVDAQTTVFSTRGLNIYDNLLIEGLERWVKLMSYSRNGLEKLPQYADVDAKNRDLQDERRFEVAAAAALFGDGHAYARTGTLTPATARAIGIDAVQDFAQASYVAGNATLIVTGNFDPVRVEAQVRDSFDHWSHGSAPAAILAPAVAARAAQWIGVAGQARPAMHVRIAFPAPRIGGGYAGRLILAEMLNQRVAAVRQRLAASYGVHAELDVHPEAGAYVMEGYVDSARAGEALRAMRAGIAALRAGDDFELGFAEARRVVLQRLLAVPTTSEGLARTWITVISHGLKASFYPGLLRAVASATPAQLRTLVAADLDAAHEVVVVLGTKDAVVRAFKESELEMSKWVE